MQLHAQEVKTEAAVRTVSKELKFEAAHRLAQGYAGKCAHNHGHSWVAVVTLGLKSTNVGHLRQGLDQYGFVKDYGDFKELQKWVDDNWDHATLVSIDDVEFLGWLKSNHQRYFAFTLNPTSEVIAQFLFYKAREVLNDGRCEVTEVRLKETCTSETVYREP